MSVYLRWGKMWKVGHLLCLLEEPLPVCFLVITEKNILPSYMPSERSGWTRGSE